MTAKPDYKNVLYTDGNIDILSVSDKVTWLNRVDGSIHMTEKLRNAKGEPYFMAFDKRQYINDFWDTGMSNSWTPYRPNTSVHCPDCHGRLTPIPRAYRKNTVYGWYCLKCNRQYYDIETIRKPRK